MKRQARWVRSMRLGHYGSADDVVAGAGLNRADGITH